MLETRTSGWARATRRKSRGWAEPKGGCHRGARRAAITPLRRRGSRPAPLQATGRNDANGSYSNYNANALATPMDGLSLIEPPQPVPGRARAGRVVAAFLALDGKGGREQTPDFPRREPTGGPLWPGGGESENLAFAPTRYMRILSPAGSLTPALSQGERGGGHSAKRRPPPEVAGTKMVTVVA